MEDRIDMVREGSTVTFNVHGELELVQGDKLEAQVRKLLDDVDRFVIDVSDVSFMDSSGLGALIAINQAANELGATVTLRAPTAAVTRVLELTSTASIFNLEAA